MLPIELWILILYVQLISQFETSSSFPLKYMISAKHFFVLKSRSSLVVWPVATQAEGRKFDSRARKHVSFSEFITFDIYTSFNVEGKIQEPICENIHVCVKFPIGI